MKFIKEKLRKNPKRNRGRFKVKSEIGQEVKKDATSNVFESSRQ